MAAPALPMPLCPSTFVVDVIGPGGVTSVQLVLHDPVDPDWSAAERRPLSRGADERAAKPVAPPTGVFRDGAAVPVWDVPGSSPGDWRPARSCPERADDASAGLGPCLRLRFTISDAGFGDALAYLLRPLESGDQEDDDTDDLPDFPDEHEEETP